MEQNFRGFARRLVEIKDMKTMVQFLETILTPKERREIPKRMQIIRMLKEGIPQKEIMKKLGVGIATVTRGVREVKYKSFKNI